MNKNLIYLVLLFIFIVGCVSNYDSCDLNQDKKINSKERALCNPQQESPKESHFGIHISGKNPKETIPYIKELGDIYVREELSESPGWFIIKKGKPSSIMDCKSCCIETEFTDCSCSEGIDYCNKYPNKTKIQGISTYNSNLNLIVTILTTTKSPTIQPDFKTDYSPQEKTIYEEYLDYLMKGLPSVKYWQVANEVDLDFWEGTKQDYVNMVKTSYEKIKSNCPDCKIGISFNKELNELTGWKSTIQTICPYFDFIDAHILPNGLASQKLKNYNTQWNSICPGKELISTESGLPSATLNPKWGVWELGSTEEKQAEDMIKYFTILFNNGYNKIFWFLSDWDFEEIPNDLFEHTGLLTESNEKKQSFYTYKILIKKLDGFTKVTEIKNNQYKYLFKDKNPVYVVWKSESTPLDSEIKGTVKITNYLGQEKTTDSSEITLTNSPIFITLIQ